MDEEWQRLEAVLNTLKNRVNIPVSIDTYKSEIARRALDSGADIINDISGLTFDEKMAEVAGKADCPVVIMHIKGTPRNMQVDPHYDNLLEELFLFFQERISYCERQGIHQIMIDPGIGFGKRLEDNYEIIRRLGEFKSFGYPILVGPSRKSFIGKVLNKEVRERLFGTAAAVSASLQNGGNIIRVHDVMEMSEILRITRAIKSKNFLQQID